MDNRPEINASEGELDQVIAEMLKKSFMLIQPPDTIWQRIRLLLESIPKDRQSGEHLVQ
jgi:hypothetical protein